MRRFRFGGVEGVGELMRGGGGGGGEEKRREGERGKGSERGGGRV